MRIKIFIVGLVFLMIFSGCASKRVSQDGMPAKTKRVGEEKSTILDAIGGIFSGIVDEEKDKQQRKPYKTPKGEDVPAKYPPE